MKNQNETEKETHWLVEIPKHNQNEIKKVLEILRDSTIKNAQYLQYRNKIMITVVK